MRAWRGGSVGHLCRRQCSVCGLRQPRERPSGGCGSRRGCGRGGRGTTAPHARWRREAARGQARWCGVQAFAPPTKQSVGRWELGRGWPAGGKELPHGSHGGGARDGVAQRRHGREGFVQQPGGVQNGRRPAHAAQQQGVRMCLCGATACGRCGCTTIIVVVACCPIIPPHIARVAAACALRCRHTSRLRLPRMHAAKSQPRQLRGVHVAVQQPRGRRRVGAARCNRALMTGCAAMVTGWRIQGLAEHAGSRCARGATAPTTCGMRLAAAVQRCIAALVHRPTLPCRQRRGGGRGVHAAAICRRVGARRLATIHRQAG
jgi:hypothetical protein